MVALPLAHISWAIADNADRKTCDAFFIDTFGAEIAYEMLITPETEAMGLDREESLMMIGDTMVIPIAPAGAGAKEGAPIEADWGIVGCLYTMAPEEIPMVPITMMRNALGVDEGGSGVAIDRAAYRRSVAFWEAHANWR